MKYHVRHVTEIRYDSVVNLARFNLRLKPAEWPGQRLTRYQLTISPEPKAIVEDAGPFIVNVARLTLDQPTASLAVTSEFSVEVDPPIIPSVDRAASLSDTRNSALADRGLSPKDPATYLFASPMASMVPEIGDWAGPCISGAKSAFAAASILMDRIHREFVYDGTATRADTPAAHAFRARRGVCQDFAHIMIIALRQYGIPAAYVSGYLRTIPPPGKARLVGADATHAWVNVWCGPQMGWVGFDPTNAMLAGSDHIFTAMGRDFGDVSPVDGVFIGGAGQRMNVQVEVALSE
ncbi:MAG: transglutaminase family protein [Caenibius sp.]